MDIFAVLYTMLFCGIFLVSGAPEKLKTQVFKTSDNVLAYDPYVDWWKKSVIYQIYPKSFKDSDNDGNGDLQGVIQKLDYLKDTGVNAIWLSPIFKSPQVDSGYDVADYRDIDPIYGTLDDLRQLVDEAHKLDIKVLLDYVPNHTSDQHAWFQASLTRDPKYDDYYVWRNATYVDGERRPPNNWLSYFSGSAWEWNENRQQYYLHQFSTGQPDLNYRNPVVVEEMKDVLKYWLDFGIDGFRMDAVGTLFEDELLRDEPESGASGLTPDDHDFLKHIYTVDQPGSFDMIYQWREVLDEFNSKNNSYTRIMITEGSSDPDTIILFFGSKDFSRMGAHFSFNFITFLGLQKGFNSLNVFDNIIKWFNLIPRIYGDNWLLGNHDNWRVSTRLGVEYVDALNILVSMLPGAQITYQGEEIGQENGEVKCEEGTDPQAIKNCTTFDQKSRDFERTPFQWDNSTNAGFNKGAKPWLPVSEKFVDTNLAKQSGPGANSHYNVYKNMLKVREDFKNTTFNQYILSYSENNIFYFQRITENANYAFFFNVGDSPAIFGVICEDCPVVERSINSDYNKGDLYNENQPIKPKEAYLLKVTDENLILN